jgi:RNA recognition motif-containing protein
MGMKQEKWKKLKTIYVGNLPFNVSEERVRDLFSREGTVYSVELINNRETGKPPVFGFVKMEHNEAISAIRAFNGTEFGGRILLVNKARERGVR